MAVYSFSRLSTFQKCPFKYKLIYIDKIKRPQEESIEAYVGDKVHKTLQKCYDNVRHGKKVSLEDLLHIYKRQWEENWHSLVFIVKKEYCAQNYYDMGVRMLTNYHRRYSPYNSDITLGTEVRVLFPLDDENKYVMSGIIDRIAKTEDGIIEVHDYKTSSNLPSQSEIDNDMQLGLYQVAVQNKWPATHNVRLIWHYLNADTDLISHRSSDSLDGLKAETMILIDTIESAKDFPARHSALCEWCEYPAYCPLEKHEIMIDRLPINEYLNEPGVKLVNRYAELRQATADLKEEMEQVREAIIAYAKKENMLVIKGNDFKAKVRLEQKLKFPGKNDKEREELEKLILENGDWMQVSQLDTSALAGIVASPCWSPDLVSKIAQYAKCEESAVVSLYKLRDEEDQ